jgi:hypothetical protein
MKELSVLQAYRINHGGMLKVSHQQKETIRL